MFKSTSLSTSERDQSVKAKREVNSLPKKYCEYKKPNSITSFDLIPIQYESGEKSVMRSKMLAKDSAK